MHAIAWWPTLIVAALATATDIHSRRIPNWLVIPFLFTGIAASCWVNGWRGFSQSFSGLGLGFLVYGILFLMGGMGAGDVKLCAAIGAWIGPNQLFIALIFTGMVGGLMAVCWSIYAGFFRDMLVSTCDLISFRELFGKHSDRKPTLDGHNSRKIPYAPAIAIGTMMSFLSLPR
jgi:prepilin peptidase CpaA